MIEIKEKEPYKEYGSFSDKTYLMYPNVMIKDGKEFFIINRREPQPEYEDKRVTDIITRLIENDGTYTTFYGFHKEPFNMLKEIIKRKHSFVSKELFHPMSTGDIVDFHGNRNEVSDAFMYRIYDMKMVEKLKEIVSDIINKEWEKAEQKLYEATDNKKPNQFAYKNKWSGETRIIEAELGLYNGYDAINGVQRWNIAINLNEIVTDEDGTLYNEPYATLTVNFGEFIGMKNVAYIDTNNLGTDILDWLEENNMGNRTDLTKNSGFCTYPLFIFNEEFLKNIDCYGVYAEYEAQHADYEKTYMGEIDDDKDITDEEW